MQIIDHASAERDEWRPGVITKMLASALTGTTQLCIFEQWCDPGCGAPTHFHAVEEVLGVQDGRAEVWIEQDKAILTSGQSVVIPAGRRHGFRNMGEGTLHMRAIIAAPIFEASFDDRREMSWRYLPQAAPSAR